jgi:hypothetical protein
MDMADRVHSFLLDGGHAVKERGHRDVTDATDPVVAFARRYGDVLRSATAVTGRAIARRPAP